MTNLLALIFAAMILALFAVDAIFWGGQLPVELGRKADSLIEWVSFWR